MSMVTNTAAQTAQNWNRQITQLSRNAVERLSSGLRINKGADDPSGLGISSGMKARVRGMHQAAGNIQDGIKLINTMDAGLAEIQDMLMRMKELAVRSANEATLTDYDRDKLQDEARAYREAIEDIRMSAEYNSKKLLYVDGDYSKTEAYPVPLLGYNIDISGDGSKVVFGAMDASFVPNLYVCDSDGENVQQLTTGPDFFDFESIVSSSISHDGTRIVFTATEGGNTALYSIKSDGTEKTLIDINMGGGGIRYYALSGDGSKVVYCKDNDIFMTDFDGKNKTNLTNSPGVNEGDISVDEKGDFLSYTSGPGVHVLDVNSGTDNLVDMGINSFLVDDGNKVVYVSSLGLGIVSSNIQGTNKETIATPGTYGQVFDLSGDFLNYNFGEAQTLNINDSSNRQVTYNPALDFFNYSSADGNHSVFQSTRPGINSGVFIKNADVTDEQMLQVGPDNSTDNRITVEIEDMGSGSLGVWGVTLTRTDGAWAAIDKIDAAIEKVSTKRADIGTISKRLQHTMDDIMAQSLGAEAGRSTIEDADMASETTEMVKAQLRDQSNLRAATLAHDLPRSVLNLLSEQFNASAAA